MSGLYDVDGGTLRLRLHAGQMQVWESPRRFIGMISGAQAGKTELGPLWLWREIMRRGPGDYGFICPTFTLMELKALPVFRKFFERVLALGTYTGSPVRKFTFSPEGARRLFGYRPDEPTQVFFGYAENPDSLESATFKAVVCDEAGQKAFKRESWEALQRRVAVHQGRILITTTPYSNGGWLRTEIYDRWKAGDPDVDFIQFNSLMNPAFPREEYERARRALPPWRFSLFFEGKFTRPAGLIYDCFDETRHRCPRFVIPERWPRYLGLDFGGVNTAGVFLAEEPGTRRLIAYREYHAGGRTAKGHADALRQGEPMLPVAFGGAKSEGQWRDEFGAAGLPVGEPRVHEVEVGIDRVYGTIQSGGLVVFDDLRRLLDEMETYSRKVDEKGEPTEEIEDKSAFHVLDSLRYVVGSIREFAGPAAIGMPTRQPGAGRRHGNVLDDMPADVFG